MWFASSTITPSSSRPHARVFNRLPGVLVDDVKHVRQPLLRRFLRLPPDQFLGHRRGRQTRPSVSVVRTASPMLASVIVQPPCAAPESSRAFSSATRRAVVSSTRRRASSSASLPLGQQVPGDLREVLGVPGLVVQRADDDVGPEPGAVLPHPPALVLEAAHRSGAAPVSLVGRLPASMSPLAGRRREK